MQWPLTYVVPVQRSSGEDVGGPEVVADVDGLREVDQGPGGGGGGQGQVDGGEVPSDHGGLQGEQAGPCPPVSAHSGRE